MKWLRLVAALIALLSTACLAEIASPAINEGRVLLRGDTTLPSEPLALSGMWHFVPDRWLAPAELSATASEWAQVPGGRPGSATGIGTYWLEIVIDSPIEKPSALDFHRVCGAASVYFYRSDSSPSAVPLVTAGQIGRTMATEKTSSESLFVNVPPLLPGVYTLLLHQSNFHLRKGGLCGKISWGPEQVQARARTLDTVKNTIIATMMLSLALGSLMLGSQNGERAAPWLALICASCALLILFQSGLLGTLLPPQSAWRQRIDYIGIFSTLIWLPPSMLMMFRHTFAIALPRWLGPINLVVPAIITAGVVTFPIFFTQHPQLVGIPWLIQLCVALAVVASAFVRRRQYSSFAAIASATLVVTTLYDLYRFLGAGVIDMLMPYAIAFLAAVHGGIYTLKFGAAYHLAARLSAHLQEEVDLRTRELREKNYNLEQTQNALQRANETLRELSITDGLTRVYNRMHFEQQFEKEWRRCSRQAQPLSILMIDADHFKQLNDSAGHLVGDLCLQAIAKEILNNFKRSGEVVARYGGEEFIVLLPDTNQGKALAAAEGLRIAIERLAFADSDNTSYRVTVSIGVSTTIPSLDQRPEQLIATADAALYEAKDAGRNRVHSIPIAARAGMSQQTLRL